MLVKMIFRRVRNKSLVPEKSKSKASGNRGLAEYRQTVRGQVPGHYFLMLAQVGKGGKPAVVLLGKSARKA